jgi:hypothetical protein
VFATKGYFGFPDACCHMMMQRLWLSRLKTLHHFEGSIVN